MTTEITLDSVSLPVDMEWTDEFAWSAGVQTTEYAASGALLVEQGARQAGRPITLEARGAGHVWITRAVVLALQALADAASDTPMTLTLADGSTHNVLFRYDAGTPVEATPVYEITPRTSTHPYALTLRLIKV